MPIPTGPDPIEVRLLVVAEMLDRAVIEVRRALEEIRATPRDPDDDKERSDPR